MGKDMPSLLFLCNQASGMEHFTKESAAKLTAGDTAWMCDGMKDFPEHLDAMLAECPGEGNAEKMQLVRKMCANFNPSDADNVGDNAGPRTEFLCQNFDGMEMLTRDIV